MFVRSFGFDHGLNFTEVERFVKLPFTFSVVPTVLGKISLIFQLVQFHLLSSISAKRTIAVFLFNL